MEFQSLIQHAGFIYGPSPDLYNPLAGTFDYGPIGKRLKNNLEKILRKMFYKENFSEVQCPLISPMEVWKASGHVERFYDYLFVCSNKKCSKLYRVDHYLEKNGINESEFLSLKPNQFIDFAKKKGIKCKECNSELGEIEQLKLMITANLGFPTKEYVLRPETATTTYLLFPKLLKYERNKLPIKVFQTGHAFRNELSPRRLLIRCREFEQCEGQIFLTDDMKHNYPDYEKVKDYKLPLLSSENQQKGKMEIVETKAEDALNNNQLQNQAYAWIIYLGMEIANKLGLSKGKLRLRQHQPHEKAHYAHDAWDLEYNSDIFGWTEICGIHDRGNYDLTQHQTFSKKKLSIKNPISGKIEVPEILEIAFGVGRLYLFILEENLVQFEDRHIFNFPIDLSPIPFAIFPLQKKPNELLVLSKKIFDGLRENDLDVVYDIAGSIGKRYRRSEEIGVNYAITIDHTSLKDNTVTIRESSSKDQKRINISEIYNILESLLKKKIGFEDI